MSLTRIKRPARSAITASRTSSTLRSFVSLRTWKSNSEVFNEYGSVGEDRPEWYSIDYWLGRLGIEGKDRLVRESQGFIELYPEVEEVIRTLSVDYTLVVTSNAPTEFLDIELESIAHNFDRIFSAPSDFHMIKRDPSFYHRICAELNVDPQDIIHLGDRWKDDVESPLAAGLTALFLDRSGVEGEHAVGDLWEFSRRLKELEI